MGKEEPPRQETIGSPSDSEDSEVSAAIAARIPDLFKDPGYAQLGHSTLSTSNCGKPPAIHQK